MIAHGVSIAPSSSASDSDVTAEEVGKRDYWTRELTELTQLDASIGLDADVGISGAILASAMRDRSDLVVMGTHGRRGMSEGRCGSVAEALSRRGTRPMLSMKRPKFPGDHRLVMPLVMTERPLASWQAGSTSVVPPAMYVLDRTR